MSIFRATESSYSDKKLYLIEDMNITLNIISLMVIKDLEVSVHDF